MGPNSRRGGIAEIKDVKKTTKRLLNGLKDRQSRKTNSPNTALPIYITTATA